MLCSFQIKKTPYNRVLTVYLKCVSMMNLKASSLYSESKIIKCNVVCPQYTGKTNQLIKYQLKWNRRSPFSCPVIENFI